MNFLSTCFCIIWISVQAEVKYQKLNIGIMTLGHSGLLIYWDQNNTEEERNTYFEYRIKYESHSDKNNYTADEKPQVYFKEKHFMLPSLNENTLYKINIQEYLHDWVSPKLLYTYDVEGKTSNKTNLPPKKPDFRINLSTSNNDPDNIYWLPCGKNRNCDGNEAGTHFSVRYKPLESKQWYQTEQYHKTSTRIDAFIYGRIYEIIVSSINGNSKTDSDIQEVFLRPGSSPVQSAKIMALSNSSILISCLPPSQTIRRVNQYIVFFFEANKMKESYINPGMLYWTNPEITTSTYESYPTNGPIFLKTNKIIPSTQYTFHIIPVMINIIGEDIPLDPHRVGLEYSFNYILNPKSNGVSLPMAKPDFRYILESCTEYECSVIIHWLPCGLMFDCKDTEPGSEFKVKIKLAEYPKTLRDSYIITPEYRNYSEADKDWYRIDNLDKGYTFEVTVQSVHGLEISDATSKNITIEIEDYIMEDEDSTMEDII